MCFVWLDIGYDSCCAGVHDGDDAGEERRAAEGGGLLRLSALLHRSAGAGFFCARCSCAPRALVTGQSKTRRWRAD